MLVTNGFTFFHNVTNVYITNCIYNGMMRQISREDISIQLGKIFSSQEFRQSKRLRQFLSFIIDQKLANENRATNQYTIAVEAFGYGNDFDPTSNAVVRLVARRLRRALTMYYTSQGVGDPIRIEVPKGAYLPVFLDNMKMSGNNMQEENNSTWMYSTASESDAYSTPSIAVTRFRCLNKRNDIEYISSGIAEEIIISLARFSEFRIVGPLFQEVLDNQNIGYKEIGEKYKVRFLLEGTIRVREKQLRLTVKLKDTQSEDHIWGDVMDCNLHNGSLIKCESHIVNSIVTVLADNFGVINTVLFDDIVRNNRYTNDSYKAILLFHHYIQMLDEQSYINALRLLEESTAKKQNSPLNLAMLGDILITSYFTGYEDVSILDRVEVLGRKAIALDSGCQHAQFVMAMIFFARFQRENFIKAAEKTLDLNHNNACLAAALGMHFWMIGEHVQGMELMAKAIDMNPQHPGWYSIVPLLHCLQNRNYEEALSKALDFNSPGIYLDPLFRTVIYRKLNSLEKAEKAKNELLNIFPDFNSNGQKIMKRLLFSDENVDMIWEEFMKIKS